MALNTRLRPLRPCRRPAIVLAGIVVGCSIASLESKAVFAQRATEPHPEGDVTIPIVSEAVSPTEELSISDTSYAAIRRPPGDGPFPAVIFLHGGLGQGSMRQLRRNAEQQPTAARFLAWGYLTVNATRRNIKHDPQDRGVIDDTMAVIEAVKQLPDVDPQSVVLYGGSGGGTLALDVARKTNLAAVVAGEPATIIFMGMFTKEHVETDAAGNPTGDRRWDLMGQEPEELYTSELQEHTRGKLAQIGCPVLVLHGDQHPLVKFNLRVFVPEMLAMGKTVMVIQYPGEPHGFYWGQTKNPAMALKANRDADAFIRSQILTPPRPIDDSLLRHKSVKVRGADQ